jgi:hypothetical protein
MPQSLAWPDWTERKLQNDSDTLIRVRPAGDGPSRRDHLSLELENFPVERVRIGEVAEDFGPESWKPGFIQYKLDPTKSFNDSDRVQLRNILSFLFGRLLTHVGTTTFDESGNRICVHGRHNRFSDRRDILNLPSHRPTALNSRTTEPRVFVDKQRVTGITEELIDSTGQFPFQLANFRYFSARASFMELIGLHWGAALDTLCSSVPPPTESKVMSSNAFNSLKKELLDKIDYAEKRTGRGLEKLKARISGLNSNKNKDVKDVMISQGLSLGEIEEEAWNIERNRSTHGEQYRRKDQHRATKLGRVLQVMYNRLFLKTKTSLEHYYDFSSKEFPLRRLEVPPKG